MIGQDKNVYFDADQIEAIAFSYENKEDFAEALKVINYGLTLHPCNASLTLYKAKYLLFLDYIDEAGKIISQLTDDSEEALLVHIEYQFARGDYQTGFDMINRQMNSTDFNWEFALDVINILWGYVTYNQIIDFINQALIRLPENMELQSELAAIYQDNQEEDKAICLYNEILERDPYNTDVWKELAKAHSLKKEFDKAIEACDFALAINSRNEEILCIKGYCLYDSGEYQQALDNFLEYEKISSDKSSAYDFISDCYIKLEKIPEAINYLKKALCLTPDNLHLLYQLAFCYQDMGNTPQAKEMLRQGLAIDNKQIDFHAMLAELLMQEENYEESLAQYKEAFSLEPDNAEFPAIIGDLYERIDRMDQAAVFYEKAHDLKKNDVKILFRLLLAYYAINQPEKAYSLSEEIMHLTDRFTQSDQELTEQERKEIEEANYMIDTLKKLLQELMDNNKSEDNNTNESNTK